MQWPEHIRVRPIQSWPGQLTSSRQPARFDSSWSATLALLGRELRAISGRNVVLQVAIEEKDFRIDGYPRAQAKASHPGVILSLDSRHGPLSWPCDTFPTWQDNVRAIALAMEALRKVDRYGVTKRGEQYTGWRAIGSGARTSEEAALGVLREHVPTAMRHYEQTDMSKFVRAARVAAHPDRHGGDHAASDAVVAAINTLGLL